MSRGPPVDVWFNAVPLRRGVVASNDPRGRSSMSYMLIRHKVQDYGKWKLAFDAHGATRKASGSKGGRLLRNAKDPNELVILFESG